jgi:nucleoside-diphosphate-sugar epimerase
MKVFVTGASGCIGGSVAEKLRDTGHQVLGLFDPKRRPVC